MNCYIKPFFAAVAFVAAAAACSESDPGKDLPVSDEPIRASFVTSGQALYLGDKYATGTGNYVLTLRSSDGSDELTLDFSDGTPAADPAEAVPQAGTYSLAAAGVRSPMSFDAGASSWLRKEGSREVHYMFTEGSFSIAVSEGIYTLSGKTVADGIEMVFDFRGALTFENCSDEPYDPDAVSCLGAYGTYYGHYYCPEAFDYYLVLYDTRHAQPGDPYNYRIALDFHGIPPSGSGIMPAEGTYELDEGMFFDEGTLLPGHLNASMGLDGSYWSVPDGSGGATMFPVTGGSFTIRKNGGSYRVSGKLYDNNGNSIGFSYDGPLSFADESDDGPISSLTADRTMGVLYHARAECSERTEDLSRWKLFVYSEESWTTQGASGDYVQLELVLDPGASALAEGSFTATATNRPEAGHFVPGYIYTHSAALGSWLAARKNDIVAPLKEGGISIVRRGGNYDIAFDLTDDGSVRRRVTGSYSGPVEIVSSASSALVVGSPAGIPESNGR